VSDFLWTFSSFWKDHAYLNPGGWLMSNRRKDTMDIRALLHQLRAGEKDRSIARSLTMARPTVKRYREWAQQQGLLEGELPDLEALQRLREATLPDPCPPQNHSSVEGYRPVVEKLLKDQVEIAAIWERLKERGFSGSYSAVYRFVRRLSPPSVEATVRVERPAGEEGQVDFGYAGRMLDPATAQWRKTWGFVMTLSWSRHQYVEFVFDQRVETWLLCHRNAFEFFEGVPQRMVIDNLKAAILRACVEDPEVQQSYRHCAEHYGFLIAPCRPRTPQHKGKVEKGGVHYLKRNFLGGREPTCITRANEEVLAWCRTTAGQRIHGTTRQPPIERYEQTEKALLQGLPISRYDVAVWKQLKLHRDCHVVFEKAYYSAPYRLIGQTLWVGGGLQQVRIFTADYRQIATHDRGQPGERRTHPDHLPAEKLDGLWMDRAHACQEAASVGPATVAVVAQLLDDSVIDRLPSVRRLLKLRQRYTPVQLEAACARALHFGDATHPTIKRILREGLENAPLTDSMPSPSARLFVRSAEDLLGAWIGGVSWN
jgi:transposase